MTRLYLKPRGLSCLRGCEQEISPDKILRKAASEHAFKNGRTLNSGSQDRELSQGKHSLIHAAGI